ncbi:tetratricopeptide repeat protein [Occallatibacter savannae]|uniref:tetratricopeptide repeat protein n=1 Tax=Occallatibacter savannae TaxID=1002691 RepID=UPI000D696EF2|nr:tetratricopeptide repeat protein [Occallatibacter savannae]
MALPSFPNPAASARVLIVLSLLFAPWFAPARQSSSQFADIAARAAAARDQQNLPLAIDLYKQAEQVNPSWQEGWWYLGVLQYSSNQYPGAIDAFSHLLQLAPTAVPAMALRGLCEFETGAYDSALRDLDEAVAHGAANEPRNEQIIRFHLALLLAHASRFEDALAQYTALAHLHAEAPDLFVAIGLAGTRSTAFPADISATDRAFYESAGRAGYVFLSGDDEQADRLFTALFAQYPARLGLHFYYGYLLFPHDPSMAGDQFREELALKPTTETQALLALTLIYEGHFSEALEPAQAAYSADPNLHIAQVALGRALAETGDMKRGTELLTGAVQRDPNDLEAHLGLASIYSRTGNREEEARERKACRDLAK